MTGSPLGPPESPRGDDMTPAKLATRTSSALSGPARANDRTVQISASESGQNGPVPHSRSVRLPHRTLDILGDSRAVSAQVQDAGDDEYCHEGRGNECDDCGDAGDSSHGGPGEGVQQRPPQHLTAKDRVPLV